ncbi:MAG: NAD(P)/FAD-dependent oxidoreductase [Rhodocyclaceae bacterium]|nr:NAD(P)/FAD-dependent oxidoreductase [Rhodocyclaceae bacterium]MBX3670617.1 NAD(P)/FAD-dependent oxidoreductase [Rhodocyclaceae bacterium]
MKHLILGNGPAGVVAAEALRKLRPQDDITMLGNEPEPSYSRMAIPYLLVGNIDERGTYLRKSPDHFASLGIREVRGQASAVDTAAKQVTLDDGQTLAYDKLLIATGSVPVRLPVPGVDLPGVHSCWTLEDARHIAERAKPGARVLQIGAGFIGCIIMEALTRRKVKLTIVEMGDRMVPRMMTQVAGNMIRRWVEKKGVEVHTDARVESIREAGGALVARLAGGQEIICDLIIAAAGVKPNVAFLAGSGIELGRGVYVDECCATNVPGVYAAGDVAEAIDFSTGERLVNAIQPNAADQARVAAANMAGGHATSQGTLALNVLDAMGMISSSFGQWWGAEDGQSVEMVDDAAGRYLSLQFRGDVLIGATSIGLTNHVGVLRGMIQTRTHLGPWKDKLLKDPLRVMEAYLACAQDASTIPVVGV